MNKQAAICRCRSFAEPTCLQSEELVFTSICPRPLRQIILTFS